MAAVQQNNKTHFLALDGFRGVAALMVVFYHITPFYPKGWRTDICGSGYLAVDLFFMLSGVVIAYNYGMKLAAKLPVWDFYKIRLIRLYPLYILGTGIGFLAALLTPGASTFEALCLALFFIPWVGGVAGLYPLNDPAWSLFAELASNAWYAVHRKIRLNTQYVLLGLSLAGMLMVMHAQRTLNAGEGTVLWHGVNIGFIGGLSRAMWGFVIGAGIWAFAQVRPRFTSNWGVWLLLALVFLALLYSPSRIRVYEFAMIAVGFEVLVLAGILIVPSGHTARVCKFLGRISYPVYCLHAPLANLLMGLGYTVNIFAFMAGLVVLSWGCEAVYDVPVRRWLTGLSRRDLPVKSMAQI